MGITGTGNLAGIEIVARITGSDELAARFQSAGDAVREAVLGVIVEAARTVQSAMRTRAPKRSGRAAASIVARINARRAHRITASIGPSRRFRYIGQMEYGSIGTYNVKPGPQALWVEAHQRGVKSRDVYQRIPGKRRRTKVASGVTQVTAYRRVAHMPAKPFVRAAAALVEGVLAKRIAAAATAATASSLSRRAS